MQVDWLRHLLMLYGALAILTILFLYLWLSARVEDEGRGRRERRARAELEAGLAAARAEVEGLRANVAALAASLRELQQTSGALVAPSPTRSGMNLSMRSQVLRHNRFGEQPAEIAASLGLPRAEVDLLLKVNRIVVENL